MNAKLVWGGTLTVLLGLVIGFVLFPNDKSKSQNLPKSEPSGQNAKARSEKISLSKSSQSVEKTDSKRLPKVQEQAGEPSKKPPPVPKMSDKDARAIARRLQPRAEATRDDMVAEFIKLKGEARKNHPAYKIFIAEGGTDEELENYKFGQTPRRRPSKVPRELQKKDFVVIVHEGTGKVGLRAKVDIELRLYKFPGPKDMILILRHDPSFKAESFFAYSPIQATRKKVSFQNTGTPGESLIHIHGSSNPMSNGKMLQLRFTVEGRNPSTTPIFVREISQLGVRSPNAGTVGNVMKIR